MVQFNTRANEILLKLVYYGPGLSGKTTNLQSLHARCRDTQRGEMFSVNTQEDRTLFFDLLPINLGYIYGNAIHLQVYTVPGQVQYDASRRVVLGGADGVVFVADSSESKMQENVDSLSNLYHNLNANRLNIKQIPFVLQYNKRDLEDAMAVGVMNRRLNFRSVPYFESVACEGAGVLETFVAITRETVGHTFRKYHLDKKIKDFDEMLNLIESNVRASMQGPAAEDNPEGPRADTTVIRHSNVSTADLQPGKAADPEELLEDALKSSMETARLYSELKQTKETLEKKNQELSLLAGQLERANQDNLKTRRYMEGLVQNIGEALISYSADGKILTWNVAAERIFGYSRPEIVGRNMSQLTPDNLLRETDQVAQQLARGQVLRSVATTRLRKGGVAFPASITYAPVRANDDRILAFSALVRDLTEQRDLEERLVRSQKQESLGRLVPALFHEVANRLTPVLLESRLLSDAPLEPRLAAQLVRLTAAAEGVQTLLRPLQTVLSPPAPRGVPAQLNRLVEEAATLVGPGAERLGVSIEMNLEPSLPETSVDPALMVQALVNVMLNGVQAMAMSASKRLRVGTRLAEGTLQIAVQDTGSPMSEAGQRGLLDPSAASSTDSLGMPIADIILQQHGGRLTVRSQEGMGNAVLLEVPLKVSAPAPAPPSLVGYKALVVDDEPILLECLADALGLWGMDVEACPGGKEAIDCLGSRQFDLIVSDIRMPGLSGFEFYAWLKDHQPAMAGRILFTTGDAFDADTRTFLESNRLPVLGKPFDLKQLRVSLELLVGTPPTE